MERETDPLIKRSDNFTKKSGNIISKTHSQFTFFCIPSRWIENYDYAVGESKNNFSSTVVLLLNSMIGSGILVQAYVFKESGIMSTTVVYFIIGLITYFGVNLLAKAADNNHTFDYSSLIGRATGHHGETLYDIAVVAGNMGALLSYMLIIGSLAVDIVLTVTGASSSSEHANIKVAVTALSYFVVVPFCLIRNFGHLAFISYISIFTILGTSALIVLTAVMYGAAGNPHIAADDAVSHASLKGTFQTLGSVVFAFGYSPSVMYAYKAAEERLTDLSIFNYILRVTTLVGVALCFLTGLLGYSAFRGDTLPNILENFTSSAWLSLLTKVPFIVHLMLYIPGDFVILRYSLLRLAGLDIAAVGDVFHVLSSMSLLAAIALVSCWLQVYASTSSSLALILEITGGVSGSLLNFIFPAVIAARLLPHNSNIRYQIFVLLLAGVTIPVLVVTSLLYGHFA